MAPYVQQVTAVDLTPAMLKQGRHETAEAGISNIRFEQALAEQLPHANSLFDLTVNRFAIHHMLHSEGAVAEMARVTRANGRVALIDLICSDDPNLAHQYNSIEQLRDPSHVAALAADALTMLLRNAGLDVIHRTTRRIDIILTGWMDQTKTPADIQERILETLKSELAGGPATGLQPFMHAGEIMFVHTWCVVVGTKH
jgi:SAM-dependent methyltransferase